MASGLPKQNLGKDFHKFATITIANTDFPDYADVFFNFRHSQLSFNLLLDGYSGGDPIPAVVEYSFNGNTVHGDLTMGLPSQAIFFDNRNVEGIWLRAKNSQAIGFTVRVEGWAVV